MRIGVIGFWHVHALEYARLAHEHPDVELIGGWDSHPPRGRTNCTRLGIDYIAGLDQLLDQGLDAAIVCAPTVGRADLIGRLAADGIHVLCEKPLSLDHPGARAVSDAARASGAVVWTAFPRVQDGFVKSCLAIRSDLGPIVTARIRVSHAGALEHGILPERFLDPAAAGGGAWIDLGGDALSMAISVLGPVSGASGSFLLGGRGGTDGAAVAVLHHVSGAISSVEVSRTSGPMIVVELHGNESSVVYSSLTGDLTGYSAAGGGWAPLQHQADGPSEFASFLAAIDDTDLAQNNLELSVHVSQALAAVVDSASSRTVSWLR